ncbi:MAG: prepilin-type N-terminal cleavage/methylation domain-containing protein [Parcubacteria group bacterium]|nr:prepilin-type N-terminal cleavage/methylation domain-containing protein [Parcubacteria group bacterium]
MKKEGYQTRFTPNVSRGFTLIEVLVVVTIISVITAIIIVSLRSLIWKKSLDTATENLVNTIRFAQSQALASKGEETFGEITDPADWGVHVDLVNLPLQDDRFWTFQGTNYPGTGAQVYALPDDIRLSRLEIGSAPYVQIADVRFPHLTGEPQTAGSIVLAHRTTNEERVVTILPSGEVQVGAFTGSGDPAARITDTRHVHASLISAIPDSATITFDFPDPNSDVTIIAGSATTTGNILDYSTTVNNQNVRVHTHTPITDSQPLLSVMRARSENMIALSLTIDFQDGSGARTVVSYDGAGIATAGSAVRVEGGVPQFFIQ